MKNDSRTRAEQTVYRLLGRREHTVKEVERKLLQKGFPKDDIEAVLHTVKELGYLDDSKFAQEWLRQTLKNKPMGKRRMVGELIQKGVEPAYARDFIENEVDGSAEMQALETLLDRLVLRKGLNTYSEAKNSLTPYLQRKGFAQEDIQRALRDAFSPEM